MYGHSTNYLWATRHPCACLIFLIPLLLAYEGGVLYFGGTDPDAVRNGADNWLRWILQTFGVRAMIGPPIFILGIFLIWSWLRRYDQPRDSVGVCLGMAVESVIFALMLWALALR